MLYASSLLIGNVIKVGITDTDDGKEDIWSNADLVKVITEITYQ